MQHAPSVVPTGLQTVYRSPGPTAKAVGYYRPPLRGSEETRMITRRLLTRLLTSLTVALLTANAARAQSVDLTEAALADQCFRIELTMDLNGKITVQQQG